MPCASSFILAQRAENASTAFSGSWVGRQPPSSLAMAINSLFNSAYAAVPAVTPSTSRVRFISLRTRSAVSVTAGAGAGAGASAGAGAVAGAGTGAAAGAGTVAGTGAVGATGAAVGAGAGAAAVGAGATGSAGAVVATAPARRSMSRTRLSSARSNTLIVSSIF